VLSQITRLPNHILRLGFLSSLVLSAHADPTQSIVSANHNGHLSWLMPGLMVPVAVEVGRTLLNITTLRHALSRALLILNTYQRQILLAGLDAQMIELFIVEGLRRQLQGSVQQAVEIVYVPMAT
jgi:hypothetical protein